MATGFLEPIPLRTRNCSNPNLFCCLSTSFQSFRCKSDSLHLHFYFRIINQIFGPSTHLKHLLMILNHLQKKFTCILHSIHCLQQPPSSITIVLSCSSNGPNANPNCKPFCCCCLTQKQNTNLSFETSFYSFQRD